MDHDLKTVEQLVEIITREVLVAMAEQKERAALPDGQSCKLNCAEGMCVKTCFDQAGMVVSARPSAFLNLAASHRIKPGRNDRSYVTQARCHSPTRLHSFALRRASMDLLLLHQPRLG
jgi:hypothetical protein